MAEVAWIAVDWGTSNLRVWAMDASGQVVDTHGSDQGMGVLDREGFETALLSLITPYLAQGRVLPVVCCGMVGSRQGWAEAAYLSTPCAPPDGQNATRVAVNDPRISVFILPGIKQISPPDVMRGEETQIAGYLAVNPDFDGVLCMPGTHTKWVHISLKEIVSFQTFMTGEMFALLSKQSVLRHCLVSSGFDQSSFDAGLSDALGRPQLVTAQLFGLRAGALVADLKPAAVRGRLSGLLIGAELSGARPYWLGQNVAIIGDPKMSDLYRKGLAAQGVDATLVDVADITLNGLKAAYESLKEQVL
ncbi:2-dehydro-3-deoxygalactonokinase [Litoreibacter janthinus]|uniref:2-keto-3-deoxygalactonate kinase n=1 Tax=Litoreibacter janthinus TaxID=670154 RepID=A0A1I6GEM4_9RHOB|nr:2-dehydro-3-deoxygalactonokinase [Litoreibacter janthinus]SFR40537.1 2-keto-3-deoxygalactonate kinase [Litoreibacter janthinus]